MTRGLFTAIVFALTASFAAAQIQPTQSEKEEWSKNPVLETAPCKKITWLLEQERSEPPAAHRVRHAMGWWGRGFVAGVVSVLDEKAQKAASEFGLSVDVVAAHITTYCYAHQTDTPLDAIQDLLLKVLKTGDGK